MTIIITTTEKTQSLYMFIPVSQIDTHDRDLRFKNLPNLKNMGKLKDWVKQDWVQYWHLDGTMGKWYI